MYPDLEVHVARAAEEFRAAATADGEAARTAHRTMAELYVRLIQAHGDYMAVEVRRRREEARTK